MSCRKLICFLIRRQYGTARYFQNRNPKAKSSTQYEEDSIKSSISEIVSRILKNFEPNERNTSGGLYLGTAGIAYMFYHLSKISSLKENERTYLNHAVTYIKPALEHANRYDRNISQLPAFLLGNCGIYAIASVIFRATNNLQLSELYKEKYKQIVSICKRPFLDYGDNDLFVGRSGYLFGALWMNHEIGDNLNLEDLHDISNCIISSGLEYAKKHKSESPLMFSYYDTEYLGAAHGLSSILQSLMCVPDYLKNNPKKSKLVQKSIDYLLTLQGKDGNFPATTNDNEHDLVHWCHGASGIIYAIAKSYLIWKDEKYLVSCIKCGELIWEKGLLRKGPGLCHGIAGNGYAFLLLYRLTTDTKYLHRANVFAQFTKSDEFKKYSRTPDNPYSLYEGIAGTACFLGDLMQPNCATFPFSNIFY